MEEGDPPGGRVEAAAPHAPPQLDEDETSPRFDYADVIGGARPAQPGAGRWDEEGGCYRVEEGPWAGEGGGRADLPYGSRGGGAEGGATAAPLFPAPHDPIFGGMDGAVGGGVQGGGYNGPPPGRSAMDVEVDESTAASVLLAHVVQLRSLWKYEHAQGVAFRDIIARKEGEVEACYRELQGLEAFVDFLDGNLLSRDSWTASELHSAAAELVLNSLGGGAERHVRLYVVQPDKNLLACVEKDGQVVTESLGSGVVGMAALTDEALAMGPSDARLAYCRPWSGGGVTVGGAVLQRVTDRTTGEVLGVVEVLAAAGSPESLSTSDAQAVLSLEDHLAAIIRLHRLLHHRDRQCLSTLMRQALSSLLVSLPRAHDCRLYAVDPHRRALAADVSPLDHGPPPDFAVPIDDRGVEPYKTITRCLTSRAAVLLPPSSTSPYAQLWIGLKRPVPETDPDGEEEEEEEEEEAFAAIQLLSTTATAAGFSSHDKAALEHAGPLISALADAYFSVFSGGSSSSRLLAGDTYPTTSQETHPSAPWATPRPTHHRPSSAPPSRRAGWRVAAPQSPPLPFSTTASPHPRSRHSAPAGHGPHATSNNGSEPTSSTVQQIAEALAGQGGAGHEDIADSLAQAEAVVLRLLPCKRATIWVLDESGEQLLAPSLMMQPAAVAAPSRFCLRVDGLGGLLGRALTMAGEESAMINVEDIARDPGYHEAIDNPWLVAGAGLLLLPLHDPRGRLVGVLHAMGSESFGADEEQAAREMADALGAMLGRCLQVAWLQRRLESVVSDTTARSKAAEARWAKEREAREAELARVREQWAKVKDQMDAHEVTALRAQADMLGLENEKLQLVEAVEAQRERNRQLQVQVEQALVQLQELEGLKKEHDDRFTGLRVSLDATLKDREALREQAAQLGPLRQALEKAEGQAKRSAAALRVVSGLHTEVKLTGLVAKLGALVQATAEADGHAVFLIDRAKQELVLVQRRQGGNEEEEDDEEGRGRRFAGHLGIAGAAATSGEVVYVPDVSRDTRFNRAVDGACPEDLATPGVIALPVLSEGAGAGQGRKRQQVVVGVVVLGYESWCEAAVGVVKEVLPHLPPMVARCARHEHDVRRAEDTARQLEQQLAAARARVEESAAEAKRLGEDRVGTAAQVQELRRKAEEQQGLAARAESAMREAAAKAEMHTQVLRLMCDVEGELRLRPLAERVAARLKEALRSQHCGLYLVDRQAKQLRSLTTPQPPATDAAGGRKDTSPTPSGDATAAVPLNLGIAGYVARTGETVVVPREAFRDARFSPDVDERPGSVTQSVLCAALRDTRGEVTAVVHVINSAATAGFDERDVALLRAVLVPLSSALARCLQYESTYRSWRDGASRASADVKKALEGLAERDKHIKGIEAELAGTQRSFKESKGLADLRSRLLASLPTLLGTSSSQREGGEADIAPLIQGLESQLARLMGVERASLSLLLTTSGGGGQLWYPSTTGVDERYPTTAGLAGHVARTGETVVVSEPSKDPRFNRERELARGWTTRNVMAAAIRDQRGGVMAVLELSNKVVSGGPASFGHADGEMLRLVSPVVGWVVSRAVAREEERKDAKRRAEAGDVAKQQAVRTVEELTAKLSSAEATAKAAQSEQRELRAAVERQAWVTSWAETLAREQSLASLRQRLTASTTRGRGGALEGRYELSLTLLPASSHASDDEDEDGEDFLGQRGPPSSPDEDNSLVFSTGSQSPPLPRQTLRRTTSPPPYVTLRGRSKATSPPTARSIAQVASGTRRSMSPPLAGLSVRDLDDYDEEDDEDEEGRQRRASAAVRDHRGVAVGVLRAWRKTVSEAASRAVGEEDEAEVQAAVELMARAIAPTVERLVGKARREARAGLRARQAEEQLRALSMQVEDGQRAVEQARQQLQAVQSRFDRQKALIRLHRDLTADDEEEGAAVDSSRPRSGSRVGERRKKKQRRGDHRDEDDEEEGGDQDEAGGYSGRLASVSAHISRVVRGALGAAHVLVLLPVEEAEGAAGRRGGTTPQVLTMPGQGHVRIEAPSAAELVGYVAKTGHRVRVVDHSSPSAQSSSSAGGGPRLSNRDVDSCLGVTSRTTITLPLAPRGAKQGEAMGVLQIINRAGDGVPFSDEDEEEAAAFADHAALILERVMQAEVQRRRLRHEAEVLRAAIAEHALLPTSLLGLDPLLTQTSSTQAAGAEGLADDNVAISPASLAESASSSLARLLHSEEGGAAVSVLLIDESKGRAYLPSSSTGHKEGAGVEAGEQVALDPRIWQHVIGQGQPLYVPSPSTTSTLPAYQHQPSSPQGRHSPVRSRSGPSNAPLVAEEEALYLPLLIGDKGRERRSLGVVRVVMGKRRARTLEVADVHRLSIVCGQVSAWLHACLCTWQWARERERQRREKDAEDEGRAWTTLHELSALLHRHCQLPAFLPALLHLAGAPRPIRRRRPLPTQKKQPPAPQQQLIAKQRPQPPGLSTLRAPGPMGQSSSSSLPSAFRRLVTSLLGCDDVALVLLPGEEETRKKARSPAIKGVPMGVVERAAREGQVLRWATGQDEADGYSRGPGDDDDDEEEAAVRSPRGWGHAEEEEEEEGVRAWCVPVAMAGGEPGAVLVLVWVSIGEEEGEDERGKAREEVGQALAAVLALSLCHVRRSPSEQEEEEEEEGSGSRPNAPAVQSHRVIEPLERLIGVTTVDGLFAAIPAALAGWASHQVRCRLWVVETDKAVLWTRVAQGAEGDDSQAVVVTLPLTRGILGHVARSGSEEVVHGTSQHMFYDHQADRPECLLSPSSRQNCGYCSQPHHRHLPPSESQRAWDEHHYNLPRLFLPVRRRGLADGAGISTATAAVLVVEFHPPPPQYPHTAGLPSPPSSQYRVDHLVSRVKRAAPLVEACLTRCLESDVLRSRLTEAEVVVQEARREEQLLTLAQEVAGQSRLAPIIRACEASLPALLLAERVTVFLADPGRRRLFRAKTAGGEGREESAAVADDAGVAFGEGLVGRVAVSGRVVRMPAEGEAAKGLDKPRVDGAGSGTVVKGWDLSVTGYDATDGSGLKRTSVLCLPIHERRGHTDGHTTAGGDLLGVLLVENRQSGLSGFTTQDEALAHGFVAHLGPAMAHCRLQEELWRAGLASRVTEAVLQLPDPVLTSLPALCDKLQHLLPSLLRLQAAKICFLLPTSSRGGAWRSARAAAEQGDEQQTWQQQLQEGEEEGGEWWTLLPAPKTGEQPKSEADGIRVPVGSITGASLRDGRAVVVKDVRADDRFNRACDRGDRFLGVVPVPRRSCLPGGAMQPGGGGGRHMGVLQVWSNASHQHEHGEEGGLSAVSVEQAERLLSVAAVVVGWVLEWSSQGQRWTARAKDLLQGSSLLVGSLQEEGPAYSWVRSTAPRITGGRAADLYLLDPHTEDLHTTTADGTRLTIRPGQHCLAAKAVRTGRVVVSRGAMEGRGRASGSKGRATSRLLRALEEQGGVLALEADDDEGGGSEQLGGGGGGPACVCCPVKTPSGEVVGALQVTLRSDDAGIEQADVPAMVQVSELLGLAIERLTAKRVGAAKFREREAEREDQMCMLKEDLKGLQEALESVTSRQGELQGDNAQLAAENELLRHETEAMTRLEEELEGERARVRRLRKERDWVLAKHKQAMADKAQQLEAVAQSISALKEEVRGMESARESAVREAEAAKEQYRREVAGTRQDVERTRAAVEQAKRAQAAMASELKELKSRLRSAEEEATVLRQTLDATTIATGRDLDEIRALRAENEALRTHQGAMLKGLKSLARLEEYEATAGQAPSPPRPGRAEPWR